MTQAVVLLLQLLFFQMHTFGIKLVYFYMKKFRRFSNTFCK